MTSSGTITVCIPAHNEEQCITSTLNSAWKAMQPVSTSDGIDMLICANACTDLTVPKIREWATINNFVFRNYDLDNTILIEEVICKRKQYVTVLNTNIPGKPNALNALHAFAKGDILIFIDADVIVHPKAFVFLIQELTDNPEIKAAGGIVLAPQTNIFNLLYRRMAIKMKEFATKISPYLNGPLYAIRKSDAVPVPNDIVADDAYITMMIGIKHLIKVSNAVAFQVPPNTYRDYFKRQIRNNLADLQLKSLYGEGYTAFRKDTRDSRTREERESFLSKEERVLKRLLFLQTWISKILDKIAKIYAKKIFRRGIIKWYTINSTKKSFSHSLFNKDI